MRVVLVGLQCQLGSPSPSVSILHYRYSFSAMYPRPSLLCRRPILCFALPLLLSLHYSEHHCLLKVSCRHPFWRHIQTGHIKDPHKRMMCGKGESGVGGERGGGDLGG